VNWDDLRFLNELRALLSPVDQMPSITLPSGYISVALHMRTGIGFDSEELPSHFPLKCPPFNYYIKALELVSILFDQPLYVFIFTDHPNPPELQQKLSSIFSGYKIRFDCRRSDNAHDKNVLEDFFALGQFECLIRPDSNYSLIASKIFSHKVVISPLRYAQGPNQEIYIDRITVHMRSSDGCGQPMIAVLEPGQ
jgi:hypothetical protein